jgi:hypothetical protein
MTPGSTFLQLRTGGAARLADALTSIQSAMELLLDGLDNLEDETDNQSDDVIKYDVTPQVTDGLTPADIADARDAITQLQDALEGPTDVTIGEGSDEIAFRLDARQFFVNPIADLKSILPPYQVFTASEAGESVGVFRWTALNLGQWVVPDPTLHGLLPDMTSTPVLLDTFGDPARELFYDWQLLGDWYQLITVNGLDCTADVDSGGQGCFIDGEYYQSGYLTFYDNDGVPWAQIDVFGSGWIYTGGPYTLTAETGTAYDIDVTWTTTFDGAVLDRPGYTSIDQFYRERGGTRVTITGYLGRTWVFEGRGYSTGLP